MRGLYLSLKRLIDVLLAPVMIVIASPVLLAAILLIKCESKGPALFIQERVGARYRKRRGKIVWQICTFRCYKLRTMRADADEAIHKEYLWRFRNGYTEVAHHDAPFKMSCDSRVTKVGRFLRRTSLDELPQLLNVMRGEMSLVGPRPVPVYEVELYDELHFSRLAGTPGITGMWQVYGRSRVTFEEMMHMDIDYVQRCSLWLDMKLLVLTVVSVISLKGAV
ncbi:MAG: sugar transferase [Acidobacteria bacterium]|nr:sugar transferase [Acidobacteriota bacterium]